MRENIVSFLEEENDAEIFFVEMTGVSYCDGSYRIHRENSPIYVFEYILEGSGTVRTDGDTFFPVKGDIYILHRGSNHVYTSDADTPWTKIWFNAKGPLIDELMKLYRLTEVHHVSGLSIRSLFVQIYQIARSSMETQAKKMNAIALVLHEILLSVYQFLYQKNHCLPNEAVILKEYLDNNITETVSLTAMAQTISRSQSQTIRIFKNEFGITPYQYLLNKKMDMAKLMLRNTNKSIKDICFSLGFQDEHYFSNYFKKQIGVSPVRYRMESFQDNS